MFQLSPHIEFRNPFWAIIGIQGLFKLPLMFVLYCAGQHPNIQLNMMWKLKASTEHTPRMD